MKITYSVNKITGIYSINIEDKVIIHPDINNIYSKIKLIDAYVLIEKAKKKGGKINKYKLDIIDIHNIIFEFKLFNFVFVCYKPIIKKTWLRTYK